MRKLVGMLAILVMVVSLVGVLASCSVAEYEYGDFTYKVQDGRAALTGFSAKGKEKEVIVIPEKIKDREVDVYYYDYVVAEGSHAKFSSNNLKKVFVNVFFSRNPFSKIETLTKSMMLKNISIHQTSSQGGGGKDDYKNSISIEYIASDLDKYSIGWEFGQLHANISYMWNYEFNSGLSEGYYWIDDEDYGETIKFIPDDPVRAGYRFGGWYKEEECVNKWDFGEDILPEEILEDYKNSYGYTTLKPVYQETKLYAKWLAE